MIAEVIVFILGLLVAGMTHNILVSVLVSFIEIAIIRWMKERKEDG